MVQKCVEQKSPSTGGVAIELGKCAGFHPCWERLMISSGDGRLGIFVSKQTPNVRCYGTAAVPAIVDSCQSIMDGMDVSKTMRTFRTGGVGVDVELPYTWHSGQQVAPKGSASFAP